MAAIVATPVPLEQIGKLKGPQFGSKGVACLATDGAHVYACLLYTSPSPRD